MQCHPLTPSLFFSGLHHIPGQSAPPAARRAPSAASPGWPGHAAAPPGLPCRRRTTGKGCREGRLCLQRGAGCGVAAQPAGRCCCCGSKAGLAAPRLSLAATPPPSHMGSPSTDRSERCPPAQRERERDRLICRNWERKASGPRQTVQAGLRSTCTSTTMAAPGNAAARQRASKRKQQDGALACQVGGVRGHVAALMVSMHRLVQAHHLLCALTIIACKLGPSAGDDWQPKVLPEQLTLAIFTHKSSSDLGASRAPI